MIIDYGHSYYRRYWLGNFQYVWTNGAPGGGAVIPPTPTQKQRIRGFTRNVGRGLNP